MPAGVSRRAALSIALLLAAALTAAQAAAAAMASAAEPAGPVAASDAPAGTTPLPKSSWLLLPVLFYTPETSTAGGAAVLRVLRHTEARTDERPSTVSPVLIYTAKKQLVSLVAADLYWRHETWRLLGIVNYSRYPNKFYGVGNDTPKAQEEDYTPRTFLVESQLRRRVVASLYLGVQARLWRQDLRETESDGLLAEGTIPGSDGGNAVGVGPVASWDTRDNPFFPTRGSLHEVSALSHGRLLGSNHIFTVGTVDLRTYLPLGRRETAACQLRAQLTSGSPPFHLMGLLGGQNLMRGIYEGRYRDHNLLAGQVEYRRPLWRRLGASFFVAAGAVAPTADALADARYRLTGGYGLRWLISRREGVNLRLDFGLGEGTSGTYIAFGEAF